MDFKIILRVLENIFALFCFLYYHKFRSRAKNLLCCHYLRDKKKLQKSNQLTIIHRPSSSTCFLYMQAITRTLQLNVKVYVES